MTFVINDRLSCVQSDSFVGFPEFGYIVRAVVEENTVVADEILFEGTGRVRDITNF